MFAVNMLQTRLWWVI